MPPTVFGRCRFQFVLPLVTAITFAATCDAAPPEPVTLKEHTGWVGGVAFSPDGNTLATASADDTVKLWDTITWKCAATLKGHADYVACVAFSPDGRTLVSGSYDHTAIVWDVATGKRRDELRGHTGAVLTVVFHPDGKSIATGGIDGTVRFWGVTTGPERQKDARHKSWVNAVAFNASGTAFASASSDNTVSLNFRDTTGVQWYGLKPQAGEVRSVAFSPDGKRLTAGTRYGITKVWNQTGDEVASLKGKHTGDVWGVAFSADGKLLAVADGDWNKPSDVVLYDTTTWKERARLKHTNEVLCVAWHPKKPVLAAGAWDKTVKVWDLTELVKEK